MQFSEYNSEWKPVPAWVEFLIKFGYEWRRELKGSRRIALISMPCDSAAAGLIALGAMVRDLADSNANDVAGHYDKLLQYARQYLKSCNPCVVKCKPQLSQCGYTKQATGKLRSPLLPRKTVEISERTNFEDGQIAWVYREGRDRSCIVTPVPEHAKNYHIEDEPPSQWNQPSGELSPDTYQGLFNGAIVLPENLRSSYSGLCLAGRAVGENASRDICSRVKFSNGAGEYGLEQLLTIHGWSDGALSRVAFFNPRTGQIDRNAAQPHLVVADGDASFLKVADRHEFQQSDLVGVIHRTTDRDGLEAVGAKMTSWRQWYDFDEEMLYALPPVPRGISIAILSRKN